MQKLLCCSKMQPDWNQMPAVLAVTVWPPLPQAQPPTCACWSPFVFTPQAPICGVALGVWPIVWTSIWKQAKHSSSQDPWKGEFSLCLLRTVSIRHFPVTLWQSRVSGLSEVCVQSVPNQANQPPHFQFTWNKRQRVLFDNLPLNWKMKVVLFQTTISLQGCLGSYPNQKHWSPSRMALAVMWLLTDLHWAPTPNTNLTPKKKKKANYQRSPQLC